MHEARFLIDFRVVPLKEGGYMVAFHKAVAVFVGEDGACTDFCVNGIALKLRDAAFELDGKAVERRLPIMDWKRPFFTDVAQP